KAAFHVTVVGLIAAIICLLAGCILTLGKSKEEGKRTAKADSDKESFKIDDEDDEESEEEEA
ncbi:MAG: hypothetical protein J6A01_07100, partial [Proteobacteria bacterium]|nr:hypothetical protein [Pseudomonadota bacterium]